MYLLLLAVAPAAGLLIYVWNKDKRRKEPAKLLMLLLLFGAIASVPTLIVELIGDKLLSFVFAIDENSTLQSDGIWYVLWALADNFLGVALVEEGFKLLFMLILTKNSKYFDSLFDGIIYAVFVSLGFATLENILYVFDGGVSVALTRAIMSIPGHMFFAVFMGYYYSLWHIYKLADSAEAGYARNGLIVPRLPKFKYKGYMILALAVPTAVHGFYDFCLTMDSTILFVADLLLMISLYIICFGRIKKMANANLEDYNLVPLMLCAKYPELIGIVSPKSVRVTYSNMKAGEAVAVATEQVKQQEAEEQAARNLAWQQYYAQASQYPQAPVQYPVQPYQPIAQTYQQPYNPNQAPPQPIPQYQQQPSNPLFYQPTNPQYPSQQPPQSENPYYRNNQ